MIADQNGLLSAQTASAAIFTTQQVVSTAGQTTFPITNGYATGYVTVFVNGTKLSADEYVDTSGTNIVFLTGSNSGDNVEFQKYLPAAGVSNNTLRSTNYFTATTGQTNFSVNYTPGLIDIFYNGAKLDNTEYTAANGTSIALATASAAGDRLEVDVYSYQVGAFSGIGGTGAANQLAYFNTSNSITGSNAFTVSGSAVIITGSLIVSGSGTLINIGPTVFSGSVTSTAGFSGSFSGNADSASLAQNSLLLQGTGSIGFATTASLLAVSSSQQQISASLLTLTASYTSLSSSYTALSGSYNTFSGSESTRITKIENNYATTGSNSFRADQSITGSLVVSSTITAQTLVVQTVTSSILYSSGSNVFGNQLNNIQTFTGSVNITGSVTATDKITVNNNNSLVLHGVSTSTGYMHMQLANANNTARFAVENIGGGTLAVGSIPFSTILNSTGNYALHLATNNTVRVTVNNSGSVGIGTTSPGFILDVKAATNEHFYVGPGVAVSDAVVIGGVNDAANAQVPVEVRYATTFALVDSGNIKMIVSSSKVGIGISNPAEVLEVSGSLKIGNLKIQNSDGGRIGFNRNTADGAIYNPGYAAFQINGAYSGANYLDFQNYSSSGSYLGSFVFRDGNFGIGLANPTAKYN